MKRIPPAVVRFGQLAFIIGAAIATYFGVQWSLGGERVVSALPEYSTRTGEPCGACHVNPGGGGPRTLRGLLWGARGRPEAIPDLPGLMIAPGVTDGLELYDIACAGCHGYSGEGLFAIDLAGREISRTAARTFIRRGIIDLGMPAFGDQLTEEQLESLSTFVADLGEGLVLTNEYPLLPAQFICVPVYPYTCEGD